MKKAVLFVFLALNGVASAATFNSNVASGNWNVAGSWAVVGFDTDGLPDADDNCTIQSGHTITLQATSDCDDLTINAGGTLNLNNKNFRIRGNFTRTGTTTSFGQLYFYGNPATITITGIYTNGGNWHFIAGSNVTIASGTILKTNYFFVQNGATVTNLATVNLTSETVSVSGTGTFTNGATGIIAVSDPFVGTAANFNFTAVGNRVRYTTTSTTILNDPYYHLDLLSSSSSTKTWSGGTLTVSGDLRIFAGTTLNCATQNINLGGNWINYAGINITNPGTVTFLGINPVIQSANVSGETFGSLNCSVSGTLTLQRGIICTGSLIISMGTLDVNTSNFPIQVRGIFVDDGVFMARQGTVTFNGTAAQSIDGFSTTTFYNLTSNNAAGVTVASAKAITNILTVSAGSFGPSAFGSFTLQAASATTCARIAPLGATGSLTGTNWIIQTWIDGPATAYWQYLGSPTTSSTLADWDGDTRFYMSGVGGNDGNACCPIFRSVRVYNEPTNSYTNITTTGQVLTPGRGFMVWMSDNQSGLTSPLVYDTRGTPSSGTVNRAVTAGGAGGGYNLVANPYACPVTFSSVVTASSASLNGSFLILQENGTYATDPNGGTIAAGQGFMCVATTGGNITFTESCKSTVANPNVIRAAAGNQIKIKAGNEVNGLGEETTIRLNPAGDQSYDAMIDLPYLPTPYDNATHLWSQNEFGAQFILNDIGTSEDHLMIPLSVVSSTPGVQSLTFKDLNTVTEYNCAWLEDLTTGERINLNATDIYTYTEEELGITRNFLLHFERNNDCSFDLQNSAVSLEAQTNVFVNSGQVYAGFEFETEEAVTVSMYDISGRIIMGETTMNVGTQTVSLTNPDAHGIYLVRIAKGNEVVTKKFYY